jgi:hypothetical protein
MQKRKYRNIENKWPKESMHGSWVFGCFCKIDPDGSKLVKHNVCLCVYVKISFVFLLEISKILVFKVVLLLIDGSLAKRMLLWYTMQFCCGRNGRTRKVLTITRKIIPTFHFMLLQSDCFRHSGIKGRPTWCSFSIHHKYRIKRIHQVTATFVYSRLCLESVIC